MNMASIGDFNIAPTDTVDIASTYPAKAAGSRFPAKGWYTLRTTSEFTSESFVPNKANTALTFQINPTVVGPTNEGYQLKFNSGRISAKTYQRTDRKSGKSSTVSQLSDFLKAVGYNGTVPGDAQGQADIVEMQAGKTFDALLDWRAYDPATQTEVSGMENFPADGNGGHLPYLLSESQTDDQGNPKKIWANLEIKRFSDR